LQLEEDVREIFFNRALGEAEAFCNFEVCFSPDGTAGDFRFPWMQSEGNQFRK
jgi:hypothetical protein